MGSATLFVFYELSPEGGSWTYAKMPNTWWWVGKGGTAPSIVKRTWFSFMFPRKEPEFPSEEQFSGTKTTQAKMRSYLDSFFKKLKAKGVVVKYKIRATYAP
jgi:hypothetical protein